MRRKKSKRLVTKYHKLRNQSLQDSMTDETPFEAPKLGDIFPSMVNRLSTFNNFKKATHSLMEEWEKNIPTNLMQEWERSLAPGQRPEEESINQ